MVDPDPNAPNQQLVFVFYRYKPNPDELSEFGFNRLSKFTWDADLQVFDPKSEEILIQQYDRSSWHNGGGMFFRPDGFLYLSLGDEGCPQFRVASTQMLHGGLFSGIIRIDVDNDLSKSHPIRRKPAAGAVPPAGWGTTFTQGYSIPNDNPWLNPDGSILEEFYCIGIRSPYSTHYDAVEDDIWLLDVGSDKREEINVVEKADNLQWPYMEGTFVSNDIPKPDSIIGNEKVPLFEYDRSIGSAIISGGVYRGSIFPNLYGKYLFADFIQNKLMALEYDLLSGEADFSTLLSSLSDFGISLPEKHGISGVHVLDDGNVLITVLDLEFTQPGKILRLKQNVVVADPPSMLSELGVFSDLTTLEVTDGIVPYTVNAPLWSDRAVKRRWMAVPKGTAIEFNNSTHWKFPEGTVFIKHFDLPLTTDPNGPLKKLETRFFIVGNGGKSYGLTYKWNETSTDAELLRIGDSEDYDITEGGEVVFTQKWDFPSRSQCMTCHNPNANYILGVKTHQLNGSLWYCEAEGERNQLQFLSEKGWLYPPVSNPELMTKAFDLHDTSASLDERIKSYLDANCASCHRPGGVAEVEMDLRYELPLMFQNTISFPTNSMASDQDRLIIKPGDHAQSELWVRDASLTDNKMPPLARNRIDQTYVDSLAKWIDRLPEDSGQNLEFFLFPNPSYGWIYTRLSDAWSTPVQVEIYSITGALMHKSSSESLALYLDVAHFPSGSYILRVSTEEKSRQTKFLVQ